MNKLEIKLIPAKLMLIWKDCYGKKNDYPP